MHKSHDTLIGDAYRIVPYRELPRPHQLALAYYMAVNGVAWGEVDYLQGLKPEAWGDDLDFDDMSEEDQSRLCAERDGRWRAQVKERLIAALPAFIERYGSTLYGMALVPTDRMKAHVMTGQELRADWKGDWDAYHAWYLGYAGVPEHPRTDRWPCIVAETNFEALEDGWHRFHAYCRAGDPDIPLVFMPNKRHLRAAGLASGCAA